MVIAGHYADILEKLRVPLVSYALRNAVKLPDDVGIRVAIWRPLIPALKEMRFVGGFFAPENAPLLRRFFLAPPPTHFREHTLYPSIDLSISGITFFGLELKTFKSLKSCTF